MLGRSKAIAAITSLLVVACQSSTVPSSSSGRASPLVPTSRGLSGAAPSVSPVEGGCGDTQVFAGPGPDAALRLADNPWAPAAPADAGIVAYFWYPPPDLVFAHGPNDGTKVLWIRHGEQAQRLDIAAHPLDASLPVVHIAAPAALSPPGNYPSGIDLPSAGCWQLELTLGTAHATMDLMVAPARSP